MTNVDIQKAKEQLDDAFAAFEKEHPEAAHAMKVMNISFHAYLQALAALKPVSSTSGSSSNTL